MTYTIFDVSTKRNLASSFKFALEGAREAFKSERNFRIHIFIGTIALILAYLLNFNLTEWAILLITIYLVIVLELVNTSIEATVDLLSPAYSERAKVAKDVAATTVFLSAILAIIIGVILFIPKLI